MPCVPSGALAHPLPAGKLTHSHLFREGDGDDVADATFWLPEGRLGDLLAGEEDRGSCSLVRSAVEHPHGPPKKLQHNSRRSKEVYQCCFGPKDHRSQADVQPVILQRGKPEQRRALTEEVIRACTCTQCHEIYVPAIGCKCPTPTDEAVDDEVAAVLEDFGGTVRRSKVKAGESIKVGCTFTVIATGYLNCPGWLAVKLSRGTEHRGKAGQSCHGSDCSDTAGTRLARAAHLSDSLRSWVLGRVAMGAEPNAILRGAG